MDASIFSVPDVITDCNLQLHKLSLEFFKLCGEQDSTTDFANFMIRRRQTYTTTGN